MVEKIEIKYNTNQIGGEVVNGLMFQTKEWLEKHYTVGAYTMIQFDSKNIDKFLELVKEVPELETCIYIRKFDDKTGKTIELIQN